jgi:hypothetical protein
MYFLNECNPQLIPIQFSASKNAEIRFRWLQLNIHANHEDMFHKAVEFLTSQGRMKYVRPMYRSLHNSKSGKELAKKTFVEHKGMYHSIAQKMIAKDLGLDS